jgi:polyisoprenoid-binding protein YceI
MKMHVSALSIAVLVAVTTGVSAQSETFNVNPDASKVAFALAGSGHHVDGTFHVQSGKIDFDPGAQKISGIVVVAAGSGNSGESSRDKKMNSDVLDTPHFAEVTFAPSSYQGTLTPSGDSTIQVSGVFTLHGTPHDITVPMQVHIDGTNATAKGQFVVPYVKWGLKDPSIFVLKVAKEVNIDLTLAGQIAK